MENPTFRSRLADLMQKSRKALRLYSSVGRNSPQSQLNEIQVAKWKEITQDLLKHLGAALENPNPRQLAADAYALRDRFYSLWRSSEAEVHLKQKDLLRAAENSDFIKAGLLCQELIALRAKEQAGQAAHHELQEILDRTRVTAPTIELSNERVIAETEADESEGPVRMAKVIPLRGR